MLVEHRCQFGLKAGDGALHGHDNADKARHGMGECLLDLWRLAQRRCVEVGQDLIDKGRVISAPGSLQ